MRDFAGDWRLAIARAVFPCAECGAVAARVALVLDDEPAPGGLVNGLIVESDFYGEWAQVVLSGGFAPVAKALAGGDAEALYGVEPLWAPFYCPECRLTYCKEHWRFELLFDPDWPDWYDETTATCPRGHTRVVDD